MLQKRKRAQHAFLRGKIRSCVLRPTRTSCAEVRGAAARRSRFGCAKLLLSRLAGCSGLSAPATALRYEIEFHRADDRPRSGVARSTARRTRMAMMRSSRRLRTGEAPSRIRRRRRADRSRLAHPAHRGRAVAGGAARRRGGRAPISKAPPGSPSPNWRSRPASASRRHRFCRSVGCASFNEFKVQLATTLAVAAVYLSTDRVFDDDVGQLAQSVMMRAAGAIREALDQLDTAAVDAAIAAFAASRRIDIYGQGGGSAAIAEDAKLRLFRLGIPVSAFVDGHQQRMSAATLRPERRGSRHLQQRTLEAGGRGRRDRPLLRRTYDRADPARTRRSPRPRRSSFRSSIAEDENVLMPTPSRYAHMAVIDTLATGVAAPAGRALARSAAPRALHAREHRHRDPDAVDRSRRR